MYYQIKIGITGFTYWIEKNKNRDEVLVDILCPYINKEITLWGGFIFNTSSYGNIKIFATEKPIDSDWPIKKSDFKNESDFLTENKYQDALNDYLFNNAEDVTKSMYKEAILFIDNKKYIEYRKKISEEEKGKYSFFICPFENPDVDHNYEYVIKPCVKQFQYEIQRADEISHTRNITDIIVSAINKSRFLIADLTDEKPNCYYEVGYAHATRKPVIIIAKEDTPRHFDLASHKWIHWIDYKDLKPKLEKEIQNIINEL